MERYKFTRIAHADYLFHSPIGAAKLATLLELARLSPGSRAVDFGCGNAVVLIRAIETYGATGVGVDVSPFALAEARARAASRLASGSLVLREGAATEYVSISERCDLAVCIGATDVFGGYRQTLLALASLIQPEGHLIVGELFWKRPPNPEYLKALGATKDDYQSHAGNVAVVEEVGLRFLKPDGRSLRQPISVSARSPCG